MTESPSFSELDQEWIEESLAIAESDRLDALRLHLLGRRWQEPVLAAAYSMLQRNGQCEKADRACFLLLGYGGQEASFNHLRQAGSERRMLLQQWAKEVWTPEDIWHAMSEIGVYGLTKPDHELLAWSVEFYGPDSESIEALLQSVPFTGCESEGEGVAMATSVIRMATSAGIPLAVIARASLVKLTDPALPAPMALAAVQLRHPEMDQALAAEILEKERTYRAMNLPMPPRLVQFRDALNSRKLLQAAAPAFAMAAP